MWFNWTLGEARPKDINFLLELPMTSSEFFLVILWSRYFDSVTVPLS